jgi:hypothetical protein
MRQENATATFHVNETVSIVPTIRYSGTCQVLRRYYVICKGWKIVNLNITCKTIRERKNKGASDRHPLSRRSEVGTRNWKWTIEGNGVSQNIDVVCCAYVFTWVTLCLMLNIGSRQWQETRWLLDPVYRMHDEIMCCCESALSSLYNFSMILSSAGPAISTGIIALMTQTVERADCECCSFERHQRSKIWPEDSILEYFCK